MPATTLERFFRGRDDSRRIFNAVRAAVMAIGPAEIRVTKSQVAFRRGRAFAWVWIPDRYLRGRHAPLVLTVTLPRRSRSRRWKEIVEPVRGRFTHHMELRSRADVDDEVRGFLRKAWAVMAAP